MDTNEIRWMLGSSTRWPERFQQYFLTPVDENSAPLYDFSNPEDVAAADRYFGTWRSIPLKYLQRVMTTSLAGGLSRP